MAAHFEHRSIGAPCFDTCLKEPSVGFHSVDQKVWDVTRILVAKEPIEKQKGKLAAQDLSRLGLGNGCLIFPDAP